MIRTRNNQEKITKFFGYVYGENSFMEVLPWSADLDLKTFALFQKVNSPNLEKKEWRSFVNVSNIVFCQEFEIDMIAAFDGHFDPF